LIDVQAIHHFIQIARDNGIEVVGDEAILTPRMGLYGFERDTREDICKLLNIDLDWHIENRDSWL
jgi:hypothetical protein